MSQTTYDRSSGHNNASTCPAFPLPQFSRPSTSLSTSLNDDPFVAALVNTDFSSPSLPPLNSSPHLPPLRRQSNLPKPLEIGEAMSALWRPNMGRSRSTAFVDLTKDEPDDDNGNNNSMASFIDLTLPPTPSSRKRNAGSASSSFAVAKRRRNSQSTSRPTKTRRDCTSYCDGEDLFVDFDAPEKPDIDGPDSIDLSNVDEVPKELIAPRIDNRVKLGQFQCVICMDNVTSLTVTHCGMS